MNAILTIPGKQKREALHFRSKVIEQLNLGMTPSEIAAANMNPKTNKPYSREHIYWVIREIKKNINGGGKRV
jgi:hypothetical protein